jgi:type I restriction enzyme S subunit
MDLWKWMLLLRVPSGVLLSQWACEMYRYHIVQVQVGVQAVGSTMVNLNTGILANLLIPLPNTKNSDKSPTVFNHWKKTIQIYLPENKTKCSKNWTHARPFNWQSRVTNLLKEKEPTSP